MASLILKLLLVVLISMVNFEFQEIVCKVKITCISENGKIDDYETITDEITDGLNEVIGGIIVDRNNVIASEIADMHISKIGADKGD